MTQLPPIDRPDTGICACAALRRTTRMVTQAYDAALRPAGLRATQFTMLSVLKAKGQMRQSQLAERLGMDGTTLTRNLQPMVKKEWIEITRDDDQRVRLVGLSDAGRRLFEEAAPLWREAQSRFIAGLGEDNLRSLLGVLAETADVAHPE